MRSRIAICMATSLAFSGCGGDRAGTDGSEKAVASDVAGQALDPCSLLTADEVTAITTDKVIRLDHQDATTCIYRSEPNDGAQVTILASGGAKQMETVHNSAKLLAGMGGAVAEKGGAGADVADLLKRDNSAAPKLGDEAIWGANDTLSVRKGDAFVEVTPPLMHDPANHSGYPLVRKEEKRAIAQAITTKVLERLAAR